jgi:hypothetical protein
LQPEEARLSNLDSIAEVTDIETGSPAAVGGNASSSEAEDVMETEVWHPKSRVMLLWVSELGSCVIYQTNAASDFRIREQCDLSDYLPKVTLFAYHFSAFSCRDGVETEVWHPQSRMMLLLISIFGSSVMYPTVCPR